LRYTVGGVELKVPLETIERELRDMALKSGACAFVKVHPSRIMTAQWVRLKCQYGCKNYGTRLTCPPYSPTPDETRRVLDEYSIAYLLKYEGFLGFDSYPPKNLKASIRDLSLHVCDTVTAMERHAYLSGYHKAFSYGAHRCSRCQDCAIAADPRSRTCNFAKVARPSLEAAGIDVFGTVELAGLPIDISPTKAVDCPERLPTFTLLLLE